MEACSHNQLQIQPVTVGDGDGGVVDVEIDLNPTKDNDGNSAELATNALVKTEEMYGELKVKFDLVIFCQPPGSGNRAALA